ncbi:peptidoglycan recognition protein 1-like [Pecten maximus]|uniref:peptidoglycan recognition protein 1-like n=1 Tax=Pecten maximus TaxID=6579 RepID=UPI0014580BDE|nr:peptidoglycan recognition protein 1-like [Pecten maximus]
MAYCTEDIVSRSQWGAQDPTGKETMKTPVKIVFIHHTAGGRTTSKEKGMEITRGIQGFHKEERKWADIGYNFLVNEGGHVFEGRGWSLVGAHTKGMECSFCCVLYHGETLTSTSQIPRAVKAVLDMIQLGIDTGKISKDYKVYGHRDVGATGCPGKYLYDIIKKWDKYSTEKPSK